MVCAASPKVIINNGGFTIGWSGLGVHAGDFGSRSLDPSAHAIEAIFDDSSSE